MGWHFQVGVVAFHSEAETPPGTSDTSRCYATQLAQATTQNIRYLTSYVSNLRHDGKTYYTKALNAAFDMLKNTEAEDEDVRSKKQS